VGNQEPASGAGGPELSARTIKKIGRIFGGSLLVCLLVAIYLLYSVREEMQLKPFVLVALTLILLWAFIATIYAFYTVWNMAREQQLLRESEESHRNVLGSILDSIGVGVSVITPEMEVLSMNDVMRKRHPGINVAKRPICHKVFHYPPRTEVCEDCPVQETIRDGQVHEATRDVSTGKDSRAIRLLCSPIKDEEGRLAAVVELVEDITMRKRAERMLVASEVRFRTMVDHNADGIVAVDPEGTVLHVNPAGEALLGQYTQELAGKPFKFPVLVEKETEAEIEGVDGQVTVVAMRAVETEWEGRPARLVSIRDITDRKRTEVHLRSLALVDELTELYNRRGFVTFARRQTKMSDRANEQLLLLLADLDNLDAINRAQGRAAGDDALVAVAGFLRKAFRESDIMARMGDDEFAVLAIDASPETAEVLINRVQEEIRSYNATQGDLQLSLTIGTAAFDPEKPCSLDDLLERAEKSLREHKKSAGGA